MLAPHFDRVGGYERQAYSLGRAFVRRGVSVWLVTDNYENRLPREHRAGVLVWRLSPPPSPWWLEPRRPWTPNTREQDLAVFLRQHADRYDAVHAHAFCPPCDVAMQVGRALGKPTLVKVATEGDPTEIARGAPALRPVWDRLMHADRFLCISQAIVDEFRTLDVPTSKLVHVPNGVDSDLYRPATSTERRTMRAALGLGDDAVAFACVGRLAQRKAIDVLLTAWHRLPATARERATLLIVGDGEEGPRLRTLAAELGLGARVRFLGERQDVATILHASDVFVFPSRREGLSNALLEAMSSGLPVIASRIGGNVDVVEHGAQGLLCAPDDPDELADAVARLAGDGEARRALARAARERILASYAMDRILERLARLYGIALLPAAAEGTKGDRAA